MTCSNPIWIAGTGRVPCGKCVQCRIGRTRIWAVRILHELSYYENSSFVNLTYNNENLPVDYSLDKSHLQKFFKRLRKSLDFPIKYFACGEYGDTTFRPHYHSIIFGLSLKRILEDCSGPVVRKGDGSVSVNYDLWPLGRTVVGTVTYESARYVAGYIQKKFNGVLGKETYGDRQFPFQIQSNGIGKRYCIDHSEQFVRDIGLTEHGIKCSLPRYYVKLLEGQIDPARLNEKALERAYAEAEIYSERGIKPLEVYEYKAKLREQSLAEAKARVARWKPRS